MNDPDLTMLELGPCDTIRKLAPGRRLRDPGVWELARAGAVVGRVESATIGASSLTFFHAFGVHPHSGQSVDLELSADFAERVRVVFAFVDDPEATRGVHWR